MSVLSKVVVRFWGQQFARSFLRFSVGSQAFQVSYLPFYSKKVIIASAETVAVVGVQFTQSVAIVKVHFTSFAPSTIQAKVEE